MPWVGRKLVVLGWIGIGRRARFPRVSAVVILMFILLMQEIIVFIYNPACSQFVERFVDTNKRFPRCVSRANAKLPSNGLVLLWRVDWREALGPLCIFHADKTTAVGFEPSKSLFLVCLTSWSPWLGNWRLIGKVILPFCFGLLPFHKYLVVGRQTAGKDTDFTNVGPCRCSSARGGDGTGRGHCGVQHGTRIRVIWWEN